MLLKFLIRLPMFYFFHQVYMVFILICSIFQPCLECLLLILKEIANNNSNLSVIILWPQYFLAYCTKKKNQFPSGSVASMVAFWVTDCKFWIIIIYLRFYNASFLISSDRIWTCNFCAISFLFEKDVVMSSRTEKGL